jgi:iron(III) transport system permease protein
MTAIRHDEFVAPRRPWLGDLRSGITPFNVLSVAVIFSLAFIAVYPLLRVLLRTFVNNGQLDFGPIRLIFSHPDVPHLLFNTTLIVVASSVLALVVGSIMAWINERTDARMGMVTDALPLIPFLLPPIAGAIGWVLLLSDRAGLLNAVLRGGLRWVGVDLTDGPLNIYSWSGLIFVYTLYAIPYVYLMMCAGLRNVDSSLEEQSRICGRGLFDTMRKVTLPAVRPSLGAAILLLVWFELALFSVPAIIGKGANIEVLSVRIVRLLSFTYPPQIAEAIGLSLIVVVALALAWYFQTRVLSRGRHAVVGGKGHKVAVIELGAWRWPARIVILGYIFVAAVLPVIGLLLVALNGYWTPNIRWAKLGFGSFHDVLVADQITRASLNNSLILAVTGATIGMVAAAILALFVRRSGKIAARLIDAAVKMPAAIASIVLAVGFILAFSGPPFNLNGTLLILLLAYLALYIPQGSVAADAAASQVGRELIEASQISGASGGRTFWRVSLPLMIGGLAAGWALLFVRMVGDLTASAILAGTNNPVVGFRILEVFEGASYASLAALSTVLTAISAIVIAALLVYTRRHGSVRVNTV